ncbi:MAG: 50S ribosomal protein L30 [Candidatus Dadabacteria bacterium]|nr:MAG: 50S ribosomal protein L30 [Candidatus Dadabacteria bacterium]
MAEKTIRIQLVRGLAGKRREQIQAVHALGLKRPRQIVERPDTPAIRGQVKKVSHLVAVLEES